MATLSAVRSDRWADAVTLAEDRPNVVGRSSACELTICEPGVSRRHAEIVRRDGRWIARDLGSRNGTRVGDRVVDGVAELVDGDRINVGGHEVIFHDVPATGDGGSSIAGDTLEIDREVVIGDRGPTEAVGPSIDDGVSRAMLDLTFTLADCRSRTDVAAETLSFLARHTTARGGGLFWIDDDLPHLAASLPGADRVPQLSPGTVRRLGDGRARLVVTGGGGERHSLSRLGLGSAVLVPVGKGPAAGTGPKTGDDPAGDDPTTLAAILLSTDADAPTLTPTDLDVAAAAARVLSLWVGRHAAEVDRRRTIADNTSHLRWLVDAAPADRPLWLESAAMASVADRLLSAVDAAQPVCLTGPDGVGKRTLASIAATRGGTVRVGDPAAGDLVIDVPPLSSRVADVIAITRGVVRAVAHARGSAVPAVSKSAMRRIASHPWPGNVPQLIDAVRHTVHAVTGTIEPDDLRLPREGESPFDAPTVAPETSPDERPLADVEREHVRRVLARTGGNKSHAAHILGIDRSTLDRKLKRWQAGR